MNFCSHSRPHFNLVYLWIIASSWRCHIFNIHEMCQRITRCYQFQFKLHTNGLSELPSILQGKLQGIDQASGQSNVIIVSAFHQRLNPQHVVCISWVFLSKYQNASKKLYQMCSFCIDFVVVLSQVLQGTRIAQEKYIT